jgi:hypothetical protein
MSYRMMSAKLKTEGIEIGYSTIAKYVASVRQSRKPTAIATITETQVEQVKETTDTDLKIMDSMRDDLVQRYKKASKTYDRVQIARALMDTLRTKMRYTGLDGTPGAGAAAGAQASASVYVGGAPLAGLTDEQLAQEMERIRGSESPVIPSEALALAPAARVAGVGEGDDGMEGEKESHRDSREVEDEPE